MYLGGISRYVRPQIDTAHDLPLLYHGLSSKIHNSQQRNIPLIPQHHDPTQVVLYSWSAAVHGKGLPERGEPVLKSMKKTRKSIQSFIEREKEYSRQCTFISSVK
jgi:hypothetical protein